MKVSEKLKQLREAAEMTQEQLARAAETSVGNVRNYEQGIRLPTFPAVVKLAKALGVTCEVFAECEDVIGTEPPAVEPKKTKRGKK